MTNKDYNISGVYQYTLWAHYHFRDGVCSSGLGEDFGAVLETAAKKVKEAYGQPLTLELGTEKILEATKDPRLSSLRADLLEIFRIPREDTRRKFFVENPRYHNLHSNGECLRH